MEMIQQLFELQISLRFSVGLSVALFILLFLAFSPCVCPVFTPTSSPSLCNILCSALVTTISSISQGTGLTASEEPAFLMHFLCLSWPSVELPARLCTFSCAINIHAVELCAALLVVPAGGGAQPGCSRALAGHGSLLFLGLMDPPASPQYCLVSGTYWSLC